MKTTTHIKTTAIVNENSQATMELQKIGATAFGITSLLIGCWAVACMTAGIIASGSPAVLATEYIKALVG